MNFFGSNDKDFSEDFSQMIKIAMLNSVGFFFIGFLIPIVARTEMNASAIQISFIVSIQVLGRTVSGFISGFITDKVESKSSLVLVGSFGRGLSYFIFYFAFVYNNLIGLAIGNLTLGVTAGIFWVPYNTLIAEKSKKSRRAYAYGKKNSISIVGQIIGALIGFNIYTISKIFANNQFLTYIPIPIYGLCNFIAGIIFYMYVDESIQFRTLDIDSVENKKKGNVQHRKSTMYIIGTISLMILVFLSSINSKIARPFLSLYIIEKIESNVDIVVWFYFPAGIGATLLAPQIGKIVDRVRPFYAIIGISILGSILTFILINSFNLIFFSIVLIFDLGIAMASNLFLQNIMSRVSITHRGKVFGFGEFFQFFGHTIGPIFGGIAWEYLNPQAPFIISIFIELSLIPVYLIVIYFLLPNLKEKYETENEK